MPIGNFEDWNDCVSTLMEEDGHSEEAAQNICGALEEEAKAENGNVEELRESLKQASGLIADVGVELVSAVDVPAIDSKWVAMKSDKDGYDKRTDVPILLSKQEDSEKRITYAPAMIPRELDKEGDVATTPRVEKAAHNFLKQGGGHDTDHSLIDGEGETVESWIEPEERTWSLPGGKGEETYPPGTWMVGIEWGQEAWDRIQAGELSGLSIYGMAEHVSLGKAVGECPSCGDSLTTSKNSGGYAFNTNENANTGMGDEPPELDTEAIADELGESLTTTVSEAVKDATTNIHDTDSLDALTSEYTEKATNYSDDLAVEPDVFADLVKAAQSGEILKQDEQEAAAMLGDAYDIPPGDVLDIMSAASDADADAVLEAIESVEASKEDDEEEPDEEEKATTEKSAGDANLGKGGSGKETAAKGLHTEGHTSGGTPSYRAVAEQMEGDT